MLNKHVEVTVLGIESAGNFIDNNNNNNNNNISFICLTTVYEVTVLQKF